MATTKYGTGILLKVVMASRPLIKESLVMLNVCGMNPINQNKWSKTKAYTIVAIHLYFMFEVLLYIIYEWKGWESVDGFTVITLYSQTVSKVLFMIFKRQHLYEILNNIERFWSWSDLTHDFQQEVKNIVAFMRRSMLMFIATALVAVSSYSAKPLFYKNKILPYDTYHPKDRDTVFFYEITYVMQCIDAAIGCFCLLGFDSFFISCTVHFYCELKIVKQKFLTINVNDEFCMKEVGNLVNHHNLILSSIKKINELYSYLLLMQFSSSITCICAGLLSMIESGLPPDLEHLSKYATFLGTVILQLFVYCLIGTVLAEESNSVSNSVYESDWWVKTQPQLRRSYALIIQRANKYEQLRAGGLFPLNLESFASIVKFALSLSTLAQTVFAKS